MFGMSFSVCRRAKCCPVSDYVSLLWLGLKTGDDVLRGVYISKVKKKKVVYLFGG